MDELLAPVSTSYKSRNDALEIRPSENIDTTPTGSIIPVSTAEDALDVLKNKPSYEQLITALKFLRNFHSGFDIRSPSPVSSQLIHVLVTEIVPTYWDALHSPESTHGPPEARKRKKENVIESLTLCLKSIPGIRSLVLNIKQHVQSLKVKRKQVASNESSTSAEASIMILADVLKDESSLMAIWAATFSKTNTLATQKTLWTELLSLLGGKLVGIVAEAEMILEATAGKVKNRTWITNGAQYAIWLGRSICHWVSALSDHDGDTWKVCGDVLSRSLRLGHTDDVVRTIMRELLLHQSAKLEVLPRLIEQIQGNEERNFLLSAFTVIGKDFLSSEITTAADSTWWKADQEIVSAAAKLIDVICGQIEFRRSKAIAWLTGISGAGIGQSVALRRAVMTSIATEKHDVETVFEKSLQQFGDQLYIKHVPSLQQEIHAQVVLLAAGHVHRKSPIRFKMMLRTGVHLNVVSNRLGASSGRARFLGMVIAEALSNLVDSGEKKMDFKTEETQTSEAVWYKSLVDVDDSIGTLAPLQTQVSPQKSSKSYPNAVPPSTKPTARAANPGVTKVIAIEEVLDDELLEDDSDNDSLTPYAKPDSDAEDSDEDPTTIVRNKPIAPVYIRDLLSYLRDGESYDKQKLGLETAAQLIRRKANFGGDVREHAEEVATILVGIQDKYEIEEFEKHRLYGMIALVVAQPQDMGKWFAKTFFDGDYSLSQRASILTTLGLAARELGGYGPVDESDSSSTTSFPSKTLPESTHKRFTPLSEQSSSNSLKPIQSLTEQLQNTYLAPLATSIADKSTGPDVLKLKTFSSRIKTRPKPTTKVITNNLATIISSSFFFPLTGRFFVHLKAYGASKTSNVVFQPFLLSHFLKTLAILLHASGPSTLALPQMTTEFWDLLLSLRAQAVGDIAVLESLLFALLTVLEINENQRSLVEENGARLLETQSWVEGIFSHLQDGGDEEGRVKMCAAGILVRIREIVEKYQTLLLGDLIRYDN